MTDRQSSVWSRTKNGGKAGFDKLYSWVDKLGPPVNKLSNKLGSEAFWPTSTDKECDKAARILKSFCKDGFYAEQDGLANDGPKAKQKVLKKIPAEVIQNAQGLAIFTTMRTGLWIGGSGGSGVLIARTADGSWSSPSGIQVQTLGLGFMVGVDIYDCVLVINNRKALEAFTRVRATLGGDLSVTAGPMGAGGLVETEVHKRQAPIFNYIKSRGFYAGVQIDGTLVIERTDENARFYGSRVSAQDILKGKIRHLPSECRGLYETLKAAEGDRTYDPSLLPSEAPPSDFEIVQEGHVFGIPDKDDPDPYGVLQLEREGLVIREAGTQKRASWEQFTYSPSITSPTYDTFERRSNRDSRSPAVSRRGSWMTNGGSQASTAFTTTAMGERRLSKDSLRTPTSMTDMSTQTDDLPPPPSPGRRSLRAGLLPSPRPSLDHILEDGVPSSPSTHSRSGSLSERKQSVQSCLSQPSTPQTKMSTSEEGTPTDHPSSGSKTNDADADADANANAGDSNEEEEDDDEGVVVEQPATVQTVQTATAPKLLQKARMVTVPARAPPPALPPRNPHRSGGPCTADGERSESRASGRSALPPTSPVPTLAVTPTPDDFYTGESALDAYLNGPDFPYPASGSPSGRMSPVHTPSSFAETPGEQCNPWSGILARRDEKNETSAHVPGAFQSFPSSPYDEVKEEVHVTKV